MPEVSIMTTTMTSSHHPSKIGDEAAALSPTSATGVVGTDDSWEMITNPIDMVVGVPSPCHNNHLVRKTSSCLDFRQLEVVNEKRQEDNDDDDDDECCGDSFVQCHGDGDSIVMVSSPPSVISASTSTTITTTNNKILSFRDAILAKSNNNTNTIGGVPPRIPTTQIQQPRRKMKPKFVVTPIKRCTRSTPNLRALISLDDYEDNGDGDGGGGSGGTSCIINEEEILGATDATEYYQQKAHGAHGRKTGMKERPDEAKRREMIQYKKGLQRQQQQKQRGAKGGGGNNKKSSTKGSSKK